MKNYLRLFKLLPVVLFALMASCGKRQESGVGKPLLCYVGGTMRPAMVEIAKMYQEKTGQQVLIDYAGSGELLIKIEQTGVGDLYVAHDPFLGALMKKGLGDQAWTVAAVTPVIAVQKGNPKGITCLRDFTKPGLRVILTDRVYSSAGNIIDHITEKLGIKDQVESNVVSRTRGGGAAANAIIMGTADACVVWDAAAHLRREKLDTMPLGKEATLTEGVDSVTTATFGRIDMDYMRVTIAVLKKSKNIKAAQKFGAFAASEECTDVWRDFGFSEAIASRPHPAIVATVDNDKALFIHCAAGMRLPVEQMIDLFTKQTGIKVEPNYDGSNRLLGQIRLTQKGDIYIPGDVDYIEMAEADMLVTGSKSICKFVPVVMVAKGNPKGIKQLSDLTKPGMKVGQADEKAAAIGRKTLSILKLNDVNVKGWKKNVVMTTATVNELAVAVKLKTIDAAIVWKAIAFNYNKSADIITIPTDKNITAEVGAAVLLSSSNKEIATKFVELMVSEQGRKILTDNGYTVSE